MGLLNVKYSERLYCFTILRQTLLSFTCSVIYLAVDVVLVDFTINIFVILGLVLQKVVYLKYILVM